MRQILSVALLAALSGCADEAKVMQPTEQLSSQHCSDPISRHQAG